MATCSQSMQLTWWPAESNYTVSTQATIQYNEFKDYTFKTTVGGGWGDFLKLEATFNHVGGSFYLFMATTGDVWIIPSFRIWDYVLHVELHVSWRIVANISESSVPLSQKLLRLCWRKTLPENYYPYLKTCSSKFCYSRLLSLNSFSSLSFLLTFLWLVYYCTLWLYFSPWN